MLYEKIVHREPNLKFLMIKLKIENFEKYADFDVELLMYESFAR